MKTITTTEARLYVGTYHKYNCGSIKGAWIDLDGHDKETFYAACHELHADESDPEFMFQDFEGFPESFYSESGCDDALWEWLELDDNDKQTLAMYMEATGQDGTIEQARDAFHGTADSGADFAENMAEECGDVPKDFPSWIEIDWEASWNRNLRHDYSTATDDSGTIWFFCNH